MLNEMMGIQKYVSQFLSSLKRLIILKYYNIFYWKISTLESCTPEFRNFIYSFQSYAILSMCIFLFLKWVQNIIMLSKSPGTSIHLNTTLQNCNKDSTSNLFVENPIMYEEVKHAVGYSFLTVAPSRGVVDVLAAWVKKGN